MALKSFKPSNLYLANTGYEWGHFLNLCSWQTLCVNQDTINSNPKEDMQFSPETFLLAALTKQKS